jgi:hypothetical protein
VKVEKDTSTEKEEERKSLTFISRIGEPKCLRNIDMALVRGGEESET